MNLRSSSKICEKISQKLPSEVDFKLFVQFWSSVVIYYIKLVTAVFQLKNRSQLVYEPLKYFAIK